MNDPAPARRPGPGFLIVVVGAVAALVGLGVWQVQRMHWKRALIAERHALMARPPVAVDDAGGVAAVGDLQPVRVTGRFVHDKAVVVGPRVRRGRVGWQVVTPLHLRQGGYVLVDRGWVPDELKRPASRPASLVRGIVTVAGIARLPGRKGWFTPDNAPAKGQWVRIAPGEMAAALRFSPVAPWWLQAGPGPDPAAWPRGGITVPALPDNHLQYAITWFSLAVAATVIATILWRRGRAGATGGPG